MVAVVEARGMLIWADDVPEGSRPQIRRNPECDAMKLPLDRNRGLMGATVTLWRTEQFLRPT